MVAHKNRKKIVLGCSLFTSASVYAQEADTTQSFTTDDSLYAQEQPQTDLLESTGLTTPLESFDYSIPTELEVHQELPRESTQSIESEKKAETSEVSVAPLVKEIKKEQEFEVPFGTIQAVQEIKHPDELTVSQDSSVKSVVKEEGEKNDAVPAVESKEQIAPWTSDEQKQELFPQENSLPSDIQLQQAVSTPTVTQATVSTTPGVAPVISTQPAAELAGAKSENAQQEKASVQQSSIAVNAQSEVQSTVPIEKAPEPAVSTVSIIEKKPVAEVGSSSLVPETPVSMISSISNGSSAGTSTSTTTPVTPSQKTEQNLEIEEELEEPKGISTVEFKESNGNWLFKRIWWERSEERYQRIRHVVEQVYEARMIFFSKRTEIDKTVLDPFYFSIGLGQGELRELLADLVRRLDSLKNESGALNEHERAVLQELESEKETVAQLQKDIDAIMVLDHDLDAALNRLMEQVNRVRDYERGAWDALREIGQVLSDKRAQELYYQMEILWKNAKDVHRYILNDYSQHFTAVSNKIISETKRIAEIIKQLKEKGISLRDQADKLEHADRAAYKEREQLEKNKADHKEQIGSQEQEQEQPSMMHKIGSWFWYVITTPSRWLSSLVNYFSGK